MMTGTTHQQYALLLFCLLPTSANADVLNAIDPHQLPRAIVVSIDQLHRAAAAPVATPLDTPSIALPSRSGLLTHVVTKVAPLLGDMDQIGYDRRVWNPNGRRFASPATTSRALRSIPARSTAPFRDIAAVFAHTQHGPFDDLILAAARHWRLDPFLLKGLLANESRLDPLSVGKKRYGKRRGRRIIISGGASGIAQFTQAGIRAVNELRRRRWRRGDLALRFSGHQALVPQEAVFAAAELLAHLTGRFGRDGGVTAYNSGIPSGLAVSRMGFWGARGAGKLNNVGIYPVQGHRFLLNVLHKTNQYRLRAGMLPLDVPEPLPSLTDPRVARRATRKSEAPRQPKISAAATHQQSNLAVASR